VQRKKRLTRKTKSLLRSLDRLADLKQKTQKQPVWSEADLLAGRMQSRDEWQRAEQLKRCFALLTEGQHDAINGLDQQQRDVFYRDDGAP
jgi:hypothetical protein